MITGVHAMMYSPKAEAIRAFFRDVFEFPHVEAGRGWLLFRGPALELAAHRSEGVRNRHPGRRAGIVQKKPLDREDPG